MKNLITVFANGSRVLTQKSGRVSNKHRGQALRRFRRVRPHRVLCAILLFLVAQSLTAAPKNHKGMISDRRENMAYRTLNLAGLNQATKPADAAIHAVHPEKRSPADFEINDKTKKISTAISWPQLLSKIDAQKTMADVQIYSGISDQRVPQIAINGSVMFTAFENYDTAGGCPYGRIEIYRSSNSGASWNYWDYVSSQYYYLYSPQILIIGGDVILSYRRNGALRTFRFDAAATYPNPDVPLPAVNVDEYVVDHHIVSDYEQYTANPWLYMACLFKQVDGTYKVLFNISKDTARTWWPYDSLGVSEGELGATSMGLDYGKSGLYLAYLGTDYNAGEIVLRKSTDLGTTWSDEGFLPNDIYGGWNKKVGPMVSAVGDRVVVVYQYDFYDDGSDWKTATDFDIYAVVSSDAGASWLQRSVGYTGSNEILPCVSHDADSNFYVSYIRDGKIRVSMAGNEFAFGLPDSSSSISPVSLDDFPSISASNVAGAKNAYATWTAISNGLDIYGAGVSLKIPPLSPTNLNYSVLSSTEIDLSWQDNSSDETGFRIYWAGPADTVYSLIGTVGPNITTYQATGLSPVTTYTFYVRAFNASGNSLRTTIETATTNPSAGTPSAPSGLAANAVSASQINLSWMDNSDNENGFRIERSLDDFTYTNIASPGANVTSYQDYSVISGTTYYYRVLAYNANGNSGYSNVSSATTYSGGNPPAAPYGLTADAVSASEINLNWTDNSSDEDGFTVERSTDNFVTYANITSVGPNVTNYQDYSVAGSTTYYYRVFAYSNANGSSGYSNIAGASTPTASGPSITHIPPSIEVTVNSGVASQSVGIAASAQDPNGIQTMYLEYEQVGQPAIYHLDFPSPFDVSESVQIPAGIFVNNGQAIGVSYRIVATNTLSQTTRSLWYSINVRNGSGISIQPTITFPEATSYPSNFTQAYRIFSIPFDLDDKHPINLFPNNFGDHAQNGTAYVNWRLQRLYNGGYQDYEDFKDQSQALAPGNAFFLLLRNKGTLTLGGNRVSNADVMYNTGIQLSGGMTSNTGGAWYLLGDPLNMVIPWDSLEFVGTGLTVLDHAYYSGTGPVSGWETTTPNASSLRPWEGLAVKTSAPCTVRFRTLPPSRNIHEEQGVTPAAIAASLPKVESSPDDWLITIDAYRSDINMRCEGGGVGMRNGADLDHDQFDSYLPPIVGEKNVAIGFSGSNGPRLRDIRPLNADGGVWGMQVVTGDAGARVKLQFGGAAKLPNPAFEAYLIDLDEKAAYNLKGLSTLEVGSGNGVRNFNVVVGTRSYVQQNNAGVELQPSSARLDGNYPNPFNPETIIRYTIPNASPLYRVTLKVFNMLGQEVATVVDGAQTSGYYEVKFNGHSLSSGVYFYSLTVTDGSRTYKESKKMMLLR
jgi:hypothetical protein